MRLILKGETVGMEVNFGVPVVNRVSAVGSASVYELSLDADHILPSHSTQIQRRPLHLWFFSLLRNWCLVVWWIYKVGEGETINIQDDVAENLLIRHLDMADSIPRVGYSGKESSSFKVMVSTHENKQRKEKNPLRDRDRVDRGFAPWGSQSRGKHHIFRRAWWVSCFSSAFLAVSHGTF